jgi:hypothetical protein
LFVSSGLINVLINKSLNPIPPIRSPVHVMISC